MSTDATHSEPVRRTDSLAPDYVAHWVVKTARSKDMIAWYRTVFGARVVHEDQKLAFLTWDEESHRLALVKVPAFLRYLFPLARLRQKSTESTMWASPSGPWTGCCRPMSGSRKPESPRCGRLTTVRPPRCIRRTLTVIRLEFQTENFPTAKATAEYFHSGAFAENPIGVNIDPDYLLERLRSGAEPTELLQQGAGTARAPQHGPTSAPSPGKHSDDRSPRQIVHPTCPRSGPPRLSATDSSDQSPTRRWKAT